MSTLRLIRRVAGVLTGRMAARGAQFVTFFILARSLSPADFGWYGLFTTSVLLGVLLGSLGLRQAFAYQLGQEKISHGEAIGTLGASWPLLSLVTAGAVLFVTGNPLPTPTWTPIIVVTVLAVLGAMGVMLMQGVLLGLGRTGRFALSDSLMAVILLVSTLGLWVSGYLSLLTVLIAVAASQLLASLGSVVMAGRGATEIRVNLQKAPTMMVYGFGFALNLFLLMLAVRSGLFVVERALGADSSGYLFAAIRLTDFFVQTATSIGLVLFSDGVRTTERDVAVKQAASVASLIFLVFLLASGVLYFFAEPLSLLLMAERGATLSPVLAIAFLMIAPTSINKILYPVLASSGYVWRTTPAVILTVLLNIALTYVMLDVSGLKGAAIAIVASQMVLCLFYGLIIKFSFKIPIHSLFIPDFRQLGMAYARLRSRLMQTRRRP